MTMRTSSNKFVSVALALAALLAIADPRALSGKELSLSDHGPAPEFTGISTWLNSSPLTVADLQGHVVLVQFWTYTCINWMRTLPYVTKWYETYKDKSFVVIGVHTPEFASKRRRIMSNKRLNVSESPIRSHKIISSVPGKRIRTTLGQRSTSSTSRARSS